MAARTAGVTLTRTHRILIGVVVAGAVVIAAIGFAGSYAAVRDLAEKKGFGEFSKVFPIGIDAGIVVLLALDLLLTWIRIPFPLLRQTAWLLTAATIAFNGAAAWPDPLGVGMHAVIPVLFVVAVEAARHAVGRIADITADRHMESVRIARWLLAPVPTFRLWRRMKLWELRSYDEVIKLEQDRLVYRARLRARYGRAWKRKAPVESLMPLRLARYGVPLAETAEAGLAAAGIGPSADRPALTAGPVATAEVVHRPARPEGDQPAKPHPALGPVPAGPPARPGVPAEPSAAPAGADYVTAVQEYSAQYGVFPSAYQLSFFLFHSYGVADPVTGQPLPEVELLRALYEARQADDAPTEATAEISPADTGEAAGRPAVAGAGGTPGETAVAAGGGASAGSYGSEDPTPAEQRLRQVVAWLVEAEETGAKLSGAEVARRLETAPRTGLRLLKKAKAFREENPPRPAEDLRH